MWRWLSRKWHWHLRTSWCVWRPRVHPTRSGTAKLEAGRRKQNPYSHGYQFLKNKNHNYHLVITITTIERLHTPTGPEARRITWRSARVLARFLPVREVVQVAKFRPRRRNPLYALMMLCLCCRLLFYMLYCCWLIVWRYLHDSCQIERCCSSCENQAEVPKTIVYAYDLFTVL